MTPCTCVRQTDAFVSWSASVPRSGTPRCNGALLLKWLVTLCRVFLSCDRSARIPFRFEHKECPYSKHTAATMLCRDVQSCHVYLFANFAKVLVNFLELNYMLNDGYCPASDDVTVFMNSVGKSIRASFSLLLHNHHQQERQCTYNVTMRRVPETTVAEVKQ